MSAPQPTADAAVAVRPVRLRAVLFDFGGTLDGNGVHWSTRFFEAYARAGVPVDRGRFDRAFVEADRRLAERGPTAGGGLAEILAGQVEAQMDVLGLTAPGTARAVLEDVLAAAQGHLAQSLALLRALRPHVALGIVSNFTGTLEEVCREAGLLPLLHVLVDSAVVGVAKPDPEIFRLAVRRLRLSPGDCAFVGDSFDRDIVPAKSAGLFTVWLRGPAPRPCPDETQADAIIASLKELPLVLGIHV